MDTDPMFDDCTLAAGTSPRSGDLVEGMVWTGVAYALPCPTDRTPLTEYSPAGDLCCPLCGITDREVMRILRAER